MPLRSACLPALLIAALLASAPPAAGAPADRATALAQWQAVQADGRVEAGWTGSVESCTVGTESAASREATLRTINVLRSFAGLEPVGLDPAKDQEALAAALMMRAAGRLSHDPGPDWPCYSEQGDAGAGRSNLFLGSSGPGAMVGYVDDAGVASLGHRRWLLNPAAETFGTGSTGSTNALHVVGSGSRPVAPGLQVAWPPPGWVPWPWIFEDWSLSIHGEGADVSAAQIVVTVDGQAVEVSGVQAVDSAFGSGRTLKWQVAIPGGVRSADRRIGVTVDGITVDGQPLPASWVVDAFAPDRSSPDDGDEGRRGAPSGERPAFLRRPRLVRPRRVQVGSPLSVDVAVRNAGRVRVQWLRNGKRIPGATNRRYRVRRSDRGRRLSARVTLVGRSGATTSSTTLPVRVARR